MEENNNQPENEVSTPAEKIIYKHIAFAMVAGAIPIPIVDVISVSAIQVDMLKQLAELYSVDFNKDKGKSIASALTSASLARIGASAVKAIPAVGTLLGITVQVILAGGSTYALGKVFESHFTNNGDLFNFDTDAFKKKYEEYLEKGKKIAEKLKRDQKDQDAAATIDKLHKLKESGALSEEEFEKAKKSILDKMGS